MRNKILPTLKRLLMSFWGILSHNLGQKLLALLFAVLLWSFVVSSNPSITRSKTINGIDAYVTNQSVLNAYGLALVDDPTAMLQDISVRLDVPQSNYALAGSENVQVTLDLSSIRSAGTQEVPLKASTTYGRVLRIHPESVTLNFETLDSRSIPINASISGEKQENMWYSISRKNPEEITISGASSVVQSIASAYVYTDVTEREESFVTAARFVLTDREGNEIPQTMLNRSSSSVTVSVDVYPTKELPISNEISDVIKGQAAQGYEITDISIQPETITIAADAELLEGLTELLIEPISINDAQQSFSQRARISSLADFKYISSEQVYVNITIEEEVGNALIDKVGLSFSNKPSELMISYQRNEFSVRVTGPKSRVEALVSNGVNAIVDLSGLAEGAYELPIAVDEEMYPGLTFEFEPANVQIQLDKETGE